MGNFLNIYPWLFFSFIILGQGIQAHKIYITKKTQDLSFNTFLLSLLASMLFGITSFLGGEYSYSLVIGNGVSVLILAYTIFMIMKNADIKYKYSLLIFLILFGVVLLIISTINFIDFLSNQNCSIDIEVVPNWLKILIPTFGGICSAMIFVPQLIKTIKTKATKDLHYFFMIFFGFYLFNVILFWILYGVYTWEWSLSVPTITFTSIGLVVQTIVILLKYKYEKK